MFELSKRLQQCVSLVNSDSIIDIGTDHAKLPIWMIKNNLIKSSLASDITEFSVRRSLNKIKKYNLEDKIKVVLSDGFTNIDENFSDCVVIAGLGGESISNILKNCQWKNKKDKKFILQPSKSDSYLRNFLSQNGFYIESESIVSDHNYSYSTILSRYSGKSYHFDEIYSFIGKIIPCKDSSDYIKKQIRYVEKILEGAKIKRDSNLIHKTEKILSGLYDFLSDCGG